MRYHVSFTILESGVISLVIPGVNIQDFFHSRNPKIAVFSVLPVHYSVCIHVISNTTPLLTPLLLLFQGLWPSSNARPSRHNIRLKRRFTHASFLYQKPHMRLTPSYLFYCPTLFFNAFKNKMITTELCHRRRAPYQHLILPPPWIFRIIKCLPSSWGGPGSTAAAFLWLHYFNWIAKSTLHRA